MRSPGDSKDVIGVGSLNRGAHTASSFSSRGPVSGLNNKPDIATPGSSVRSTSNRGGYVSMSGTSMNFLIFILNFKF